MLKNGHFSKMKNRISKIPFLFYINILERILLNIKMHIRPMDGVLHLSFLTFSPKDGFWKTSWKNIFAPKLNLNLMLLVIFLISCLNFMQIGRDFQILCHFGLFGGPCTKNWIFSPNKKFGKYNNLLLWEISKK